MDYVRKMAEAASQVSFLSGLDNLAYSLSQRIDDAVKNIQREIQENESLEKEHRLVEKEFIIKSKEENTEGGKII